MKQFILNQIGKFDLREDGTFIQIEPEYIPALQALDGFSHINILWWFSLCDNPKSRNILSVSAPYRCSPPVMGTFATRSPNRPNPIAFTTAQILSVDEKKGLIQIDYTDADQGSPVLDLKPYAPSLDRVENPKVPNWCSHWPKSLEESGNFDWENEFKEPL